MNPSRCPRPSIPWTRGPLVALAIVALFVLSSLAGVPTLAHGGAAIASPDHGAATPGAAMFAGAERSLALGEGPAHGVPLQCEESAAASGQCSSAARTASADVPLVSGSASGLAGWQDLSGDQSNSPGPQSESMMAYLPSLGGIVLVGGSGTLNSTQTWLFKGGLWSDITSSVTGAPSARWAGGLVDDVADGYLVLFGGRNGFTWFNDTWTFNGTTWKNLALTHAPAPRAYFTMVYDPTDAYVVVFSGGCWCGPSGSRVVYNDTWTFSAGAWTNLTPTLTASPPRLQFAPGAWDAADGYLLIFGGGTYGACGGTNLTWSFVGGAWTNRTLGSNGPPVLGGNDAMAYDPTAGVVVYFGGVTTTACASYGGTWMYRNGTWEDITPYLGDSGPPASGFGPLTWDTAAGYLVLYGGNAQTGGPLGTTFALHLNSTFLVKASASVTGGPAPLSVRFVASATGGVAPYNYTWDPGDGSANSTGAYFNHTYAKAGSYEATVLANDSSNASAIGGVEITATSAKWVPFPSTAVQPPWAYAAAMTYDPQIDGLLLFGGSLNVAPYGYSGETWEYTNGTWQNISTSLALAPSARYGASLTYDENDSYALLFGGSGSGCSTTVGNYTGGNICNDTWTFTPSAGWVEIYPTTSPPGLYEAMMVDDLADGYVVLYGGYCYYCDGGYYQYSHDTWTFSGGQWTDWSSRTTTEPKGVESAAGAYDAAAGEIVLYTGTDACPSKGETWTFSKGNWTELSLTTQPAGTLYGSLAYDPTLQEVVDFGGYTESTSNCDYKIYNETWTFSNGSWTDATSTTQRAPATDEDVEMSYDDAAGAVIFVGDEGLYYGGSSTQSTWSWPGTPLVTTSTAKPSEGVAPFNVTFTASTTGGLAPYNDSWNFGDGSPNATGSTVNHTFAAVGSYQVTLTATDTGGRVSVTYLTVAGFAPLLATPSSTALFGEAPWTVHFYSNSTGGVPPLTRAWTFGDGTTSTAASPEHVYPAGNFTVGLTVTDASGSKQTWSTEVQVLPHLALAPTESVAVGQFPLVVNFTAGVSGGEGPFVYSWDFGDGTPNSSAAAPSHTFTTEGNWTVHLTVDDALGVIVSALDHVLVTFPLAVRPSETTTSGLLPLSVTFSDATAGGSLPYNLTWNFGDGSADAYGIEVEHTYRTAGNYTASETVRDGVGTVVTAPIQIQVIGPLGALMTSNATSLIAGTSVAFSLTPLRGEGPFTYAFRFGDGGTASGAPTANHTFASAGTFEVRGTVTDALHETAAAYVNVTVIPLLLAHLVVSVQTLTVGQTLNLSADPTGGVGPYMYLWMGLPNGCTSTTSPLVSCVPTTADNYSISVTITDTSHQNRTASTWVLVTAAPSGNVGGNGGSGVGGSDLLFGALVVVAVAVVAVVLLLRRRSPPAGPLSTDEPSEPVAEADEGMPPVDVPSYETPSDP